jgi:hypothetical protein
MDSLSRLSELQVLSKIDLSLPTLAQTYLESPTDANYAPLDTAIRAVISGTSGSRIVVSASDGNVAYDSNANKLDATVSANIPKLNTNTNSKNKTINENHNTRASIMTACLNSSGIGIEQKYSSSTGKFEQYLAIRIGSSSTYIIGVIRYSLS